MKPRIARKGEICLKQYRFLGLFIVCIMLVGCQKAADTTIHVTTDSVRESTEPTSESLLLKQNFMLIQTDAAHFPQSQGVFDIQSDQMTVVKQYIPVDNLNIIQDNKLNADGSQDTNQVAEDVMKTFPDQTYDADPYKVYETVITDITVSIDDSQLLIKGADNYQQLFTFQNDNSTQVKDQNDVIYEVRISK